jgi:hypothetical protein
MDGAKALEVVKDAESWNFQDDETEAKGEVLGSILPPKLSVNRSCR